MLPKITNVFRMTRDPEIRYSPDQTAIASIGLVCSEKYGDREITLFVDAVAFAKTAEMIAKIKKGQRVFIFGKLKTDTWQDKATGKNRSKQSIVIESFEFIEPKQQSQQQQSNQGYQQGNGGYQKGNGYQNNQQSSGYNNVGFHNQGNQGFNEQPEDD